MTSNAFNVTISPDNKTATFSEATLFPEQVFRIDRTVSDGSPVDLTLTAVPEPSSALGLSVLMAGAVGIAPPKFEGI